MSNPKPLNPTAQEWSPSPPLLPHLMFGQIQVNFPYNHPQPPHFYCRHPTPPPHFYYRQPTPPPLPHGHRRGSKNPIPPRKRRPFIASRNRPMTTEENKVQMKISDHRRSAARTSETVISPPSSTTNSFTTVRIRHIPNGLRRNFMLDFVDGYCRDHTLEYDFLYLPMDFIKNKNLGFAFVNFTTAKAANVFKSELKNYEWKAIVPASKKICDTDWATVQGKEGQIGLYKKSTFTCDSIEFLPVILDPPHNGSNSNLAKPLTVGKFRKKRA